MKPKNLQLQLPCIRFLLLKAPHIGAMLLQGVYHLRTLHGATGHALKKTSCHNTEPTELGNYTIDVQFGITCVQSIKASFAVQTFGILRRHMELAKVRWFSVNVLFTCMQNPSLRTHLNFLRIGLCYILVDLHYKGLPHILGLPKHVPKSDRKRTSSQRVVLALLR